MEEQTERAVDFLRQEGIVAPDRLEFPVTLIGAGGIGSPTALLLCKMGVKDMVVWDFDTIEPHNQPNQFYRTDQNAMSKVDALRENVQQFTGVPIRVHAQKFELTKGATDIVIVAVDSMDARKEIWDDVKRGKKQTKLLLDGRMGGETGMVLSCYMEDKISVRTYEATLYSDADAEELPCTERAIIYNTFAMASYIGKMVQMYATQQRLPKCVTFSLKELGMIVER